MKTFAGPPIVQVEKGKWEIVIVNLSQLFDGVPWTVEHWIDYTAGNDHKNEGWQPDGTTVEDGLFTKQHKDNCLLKREVTVWMSSSHPLYDHAADHKLYWGEVILSAYKLPKQPPYYKFTRTDRSIGKEIVAYESGRFVAPKAENVIPTVVIE